MIVGNSRHFADSLDVFDLSQVIPERVPAVGASARAAAEEQAIAVDPSEFTDHAWMRREVLQYFVSDTVKNDNRIATAFIFKIKLLALGVC